MKKSFVKILCLTSILALFGAPIRAFDLDETVDDDIRKHYNDSKLINDVNTTNNNALNKSLNDAGTNTGDEEELPPLPNITKSKPSAKKSEVINNAAIITPPKSVPYTAGSKKVRKGTLFDVVSSSAISDWQGKGTNVKFVMRTAKTAKHYNIPSYTTFSGKIIEVHPPQVSCNGGLVVIHLYSMNYKGQTVPINGYIVRANDKKVFFNNIKGKRTYLKTVWKKGNWGRSLFNNMLNLTVRLGGDTSTLVLAPFPFLYGTVCVGLNTIASPVTAFFQKGKHLSIPAGSKFRIRLIDDIYID